MSYRQKQGKNTAWRTSLLKNLVSELIVHEKLTLVHKRAKMVQSEVEKLITLAKKGELHHMRQAAKIVKKIDAGEGRDALQKLFQIIGPRYKDRPGGYTKVLKAGPRRGDSSEMAIIELV